MVFVLVSRTLLARGDRDLRNYQASDQDAYRSGSLKVAILPCASLTPGRTWEHFQDTPGLRPLPGRGIYLCHDLPLGRRMKTTKRSILIVEDNVQLAICLEMLLEAHDFEVCRTSDVAGGLEYIKLMDFDVILCDFVMPGLTGDLLYAAAATLKPHLLDRFIFMSGHSDEQKWVQFATTTNRPVFWKPFAVGELLQTIENVAQSNRLTGMRTQVDAACCAGGDVSAGGARSTLSNSHANLQAGGRSSTRAVLVG